MLITPFLTIFRRFPTTFRRFPKIFQNCFEGQTNVSEHFPNNSEHFPKIAEDDRRRSEDVSIIHQQMLVYLKGQKRNVIKHDIFPCEDISSHARISYRFYQFVTTRYTTDFYIIKAFILKKGKLKHCELFLYPKYPAEKNAIITIMNHNYDCPIFF